MFFFKFTADLVVVLDWIVGSCQVNLLKSGQGCSKSVNVNPGLKVNCIIPFSPIHILFAALF